MRLFDLLRRYRSPGVAPILAEARSGPTTFTNKRQSCGFSGPSNPRCQGPILRMEDVEAELLAGLGSMIWGLLGVTLATRSSVWLPGWRHVMDQAPVTKTPIEL